MNYLVDYHTHSTNSIDGKDTVLQICRSALDRGLKEIAITDHFEPSKSGDSHKSYRPNVYIVDILKAREKFRGRLKIKMGVELGQPHQFNKISEAIIDSFPYDYVLGSAHKLKEGSDVKDLDFSRIKMDDLCNTYIDELIDLAKWGKFDCIGHLDLIKRYAANSYKDKITLMPYRDRLEELFKIVISSGKGIEINTSGLRQGPKETMPGIDVLRFYRELGGEVLTIGSDAHCAEDIGKGIAEAVELALEAGFRYLTLFNNRVPEWKRIADKGYVYSFQKLNIS